MHNFEYYRARLVQEDTRARHASSAEVEYIHRALASLYARRATEALEQASSNDAAPDLQRSA